MVDLKKQLRATGKRGNVSLEQLENAENVDELFGLIRELFLEPLSVWEIQHLLDMYNLQELYILANKYPDRRVGRLLHKKREVA